MKWKHNNKQNIQYFHRFNRHLFFLFTFFLNNNREKKVCLNFLPSHQLVNFWRFSVFRDYKNKMSTKPGDTASFGDAMRDGLFILGLNSICYGDIFIEYLKAIRYFFLSYSYAQQVMTVYIMLQCEHTFKIYWCHFMLCLTLPENWNMVWKLTSNEINHHHHHHCNYEFDKQQQQPASTNFMLTMWAKCYIVKNHSRINMIFVCKIIWNVAMADRLPSAFFKIATNPDR